jgi:integrase
MVSAGLYLKDPKAEKPTPIYILLNPGRGKPTTKIYTGLSIQPDQWTAGKVQRARTRGKGQADNAAATNTNLERMVALVLQFYSNQTAQGHQPTAQELRDSIEPDQEPEDEADEPADEEPQGMLHTNPLLRDVAAAWVKHYRAKYSDNHLRKMKPLVDHWEAFHPGVRINDLLPDPVTRESRLVQEWINYLLEDAPQRQGGFGMESNSAGGYIRWLRLLIKFAGHSGEWLKDELTYEVQIEPLEYKEVMQLYAAPMPRPWLEIVRDCFVFNCLTGPRYENLAGLTHNDVTTQPQPDGGTQYLLSYTPHKGRNKRKVTVALPAVAVAIWKHYEGRLPVPCNQDMNSYIKEAAQAAGLCRPILQVRQRGNKRIERRGELWEFITCHGARHTYATMLLDGGADLGAAQDGLGHANVQTTRRYAKTREQVRHTATLSAFDRLAQENQP